MSQHGENAELAALVQEQIHEMTDAERAGLSPEYRAAAAGLGVRVGRRPVNGRHKAVSETVIDAELARLVDDRAASVAEGAAVKALLAGSPLRLRGASSGHFTSGASGPPHTTCGSRVNQLSWVFLREEPMKKYKVTLTPDERQHLQDLIAAGTAAAKKLAHARILLKADAAAGGPAWPDNRIADAVEVSTDTVARVRERFVEQGLEAALVRKKQDKPSRERTLDGRAEAKLIALACSAPPDGRTEWTMQLLADRLVALKIVGTISDETVRRTLKTTRSSRG